MVALLNGQGVKVLSKYYIYSCRPELLSVLVRETFFCNRQQSMERCNTGQSPANERFGDFFLFKNHSSFNLAGNIIFFEMAFRMSLFFALTYLLLHCPPPPASPTLRQSFFKPSCHMTMSSFLAWSRFRIQGQPLLYLCGEGRWAHCFLTCLFAVEKSAFRCPI